MWHDSNEYFIAEAVYTPPPPPPAPPAPSVSASLSGSITNLRSIRGSSRMTATYTSNVSLCDSSGYCGWFPFAVEAPAAGACDPDGTDIAYVGDVQSRPGIVRETDDFYPDFSAGRLCLYAYHGGANYPIAETLYFHGPAPSQRTSVGSQVGWFYFPKSCVQPGSEVQLRIAPGGGTVRVKRVVFSLDRSRRTDRSASWLASFSTSRFGHGSVHRASAKVSYTRQGVRGALIKRIVRTFRIC